MSKFWGSRFDGATDSLADQFSFSISYDCRLALYDCIGGIAHAKMLGECGIISKTDANKITAGLKKIGKQIEDGQFKFDQYSDCFKENDWDGGR